ncbi:Uncharacterised protein [Mycobacteroides abscessus]|nr:Uncharacterised protein [Mycobacteroides abscessus]
MQLDGLGVRVALQQGSNRLRRALQKRVVGEQGLDRTKILGVQASLGTLEHLLEAITPGDVQPRRVGDGGVRGAVTVTDGQLHVAVEPLGVAHFGDITEVLLGGQLHRGDDLVAALGHRVGVTGDIVEQTTATRCGVIDLVNIRAQLATPGGHAALRLSGRHPFRSALGLHQHLLDRRRRGGFQGGHGRGADQNAVDRHQREAEFQCPTATEVFGGLLGRADAPAHTHGDVGARTQLRVGGQQQVVEVFPRVVTTRTTALDVHDDRPGRNLSRDTHHRADLLDGAWLEHDVAEPDFGELIDKRDGLFQLRDTGGDDDTVDRRPGLTGLLHQALRTHLQLPQVGVEEQRVELDLTARLQQPGQFLDALTEDLLGDLPTTGELGPVARIRRSRNDLGVHGGRRHARQKDRRTSGEAGELGGQLDRAVRQRHHCGRERGPRPGHLGNRAVHEEVPLSATGGGRHDPDSQAADDGGGQPGEQVAGT